MNLIQHVIEPDRLWLIWRSGPTGEARTRRVVGEIVWDQALNAARLRYLVGSDDFNCAVADGFKGYPAFDVNLSEHTKGVIDAFMRRLPPRNREDFGEYLARHRLPQDRKISDLALLGYTGAKLPGDGFELCIDLENACPPFEFVLEVAGFRHQRQVKPSDVYVGDPVTFKAEPENVHDSNAIAVYLNGSRVGYVNRVYARVFKKWLSRGYKFAATVDRINGKPERPLIYLFLTVANS